MPSSPVRSVSAWSLKPLLVLSSSPTVVHELSQAFSGHQLAFRQEFVSELLHFSVLSSQSGTLLFEDFSILLDEIAIGSFYGLIVIPPVSTWSRARNSEIRGPPQLRSRQSALGIQGLCPKLLEQVREHTEALELCVMALDVWCKSVPSRPFFFVAPEDKGGQQQHGPASIWQLAEVIAIVQRTREVTRSSAFACELRAADSPRPLAFISNMSFLDSRLVQGWPQLRLKGDFLQYSGTLSRSCSCGKNHRKSCRCFRSASGQRCCKQQTRPLRMALQVRREVFKSVVKERTRSMGRVLFVTLGHQLFVISGQPYGLFRKVLGCVPPCSRMCFLSNSASRIAHVDYRGSSVSSGVAGVIPAVADGGFEQVRGPARDLAVESLRRSSPVENAGTGSAKPGVGVVGACGLSDNGVVQVGRSAGSRNRNKSLSAELGSRLSRFLGRAGFRSSPCTLVKSTRSRRFQSIRVQSLVMVNSPYS